MASPDLLIAGTLPGVIAGSIIRVELLPGPRAFEAVIAIVLIPLGTWLVLRRSPQKPNGTARVRLSSAAIVGVSLLVGTVGGIYGIGGGSILAPVLVASGRSTTDVAPATLASTFLTSLAGVATFVGLSQHHHGSIAPAWAVGIALGAGGLIGGYLGALGTTPSPRGTDPSSAGPARDRYRHPIRLARRRPVNLRLLRAKYADVRDPCRWEPSLLGPRQTGLRERACGCES